ncbi:DUF1127 domain-containing protein [Planktotalea sp.]|uniref:DUF1127 domain-containing protein n=1 Tax=Planktotalea sp. TaxID=2029877 RepID=UPI003D69FF53
MAVLDQVPATTSSFLPRIGAAIWEMLMNAAEARTRSSEVEYYSAMSDEELASLGLERSEIARHVFRDMYIL